MFFFCDIKYIYISRFIKNNLFSGNYEEDRGKILQFEKEIKTLQNENMELK
jgi:hypothetical protein